MIKISIYKFHIYSLPDMCKYTNFLGFSQFRKQASALSLSRKRRKGGLPQSGRRPDSSLGEGANLPQVGGRWGTGCLRAGLSLFRKGDFGGG